MRLGHLKGANLAVAAKCLSFNDMNGWPCAIFAAGPVAYMTESQRFSRHRLREELAVRGGNVQERDYA